MVDVSIVLLTKNPGEEIFETFKKIYSQNTNFTYEVILVDSGTKEEMISRIKKYPLIFYQINPSEFNFGKTRDYGFSLSRGNFIITLSQDVVPCDEYWIDNLIKPFFSDENIVAVQGTEAKKINGDIFYWDRRGYFYFTRESKRWSKKYGIGLSFVNCAVKKSFWDANRMGLMPFAEDKTLQLKIENSNKVIFLAKEAKCWHGHQYDLFSLKKRVEGEGVGWRANGVIYSLGDCVLDICENGWMLKSCILSIVKGERRSFCEIFFFVLRPVFLWLGNNKTA